MRSQREWPLAIAAALCLACISAALVMLWEGGINTRTELLGKSGIRMWRWLPMLPVGVGLALAVFIAPRWLYRNRVVTAKDYSRSSWFWLVFGVVYGALLIVAMLLIHAYMERSFPFS